jgi:hypothetical protein
MLAPAIILGMPMLWVIGGVPSLMTGIVFYLRGRRIAVSNNGPNKIA